MCVAHVSVIILFWCKLVKNIAVGCKTMSTVAAAFELCNLLETGPFWLVLRHIFAARVGHKYFFTKLMLKRI